MISEARTKTISWLKRPKNAVIAGIISVGVVSAGTVSTFALTGGFNNKESVASQNSVSTSESTEDPQDISSDNQNTETPTETTANEGTPSTTPTPQQSSPSPSTPTPPAPQAPAQPALATYGDTYPADLRDAPVSSKIDQWGLDNRQSTSYTAWKVNEAFGSMPKWGYSGNGNANNWPVLADNSSIPRGTAPRVNSVGVSGNFTVWVEAVNGDKIDVSFYNWGNNGAFGYWNNVPASQFATYIYF